MIRPRERYGHAGPSAFGDVELLALALGTGAGGRSNLAIATSLVEEFDSIGGVARADPTELTRVPGIGPARAVRLHAALEAGRRSLRAARAPETPVTTAAEAWRHLGPALEDLRDEELHGLYLDRRRHPIACRMLTRGSDGFTVVDPRQVFRPAIALGASAVILAHNHPSGDPTPSAQDRDVTRRVAAAGRILGVSLLDHLVVGRGSWVSLAERGELPTWGASGPGWTSE